MEGLTYTKTGSSTTQYNFTENPFNSTTFGLTLGAGLRQKLSDNLSIQFMLNYQLGLGDVKNLQSQYYIYSATSTGNFYDSSDPNRLKSHKNSSIGLMIGITKRL